ncbi:DUF5107 domain-containing protein [Paenibacillaceae bacterium]|nr:DUF5107 domain-containing protein [Paenibacillaceae bacterium]
MRKSGYQKRIAIIFMLLVFTLGSVPSALANPPSGTLTIYDSTVDFDHFAFELFSDNGMKSWDEDTVTTTTFNTKVIENDFLKVTLLPDYGGRILSIIYKPTGNDLLYQNPVGTPYGIGEGNFYYNWLMVYGGIFPTFSEPEHGKYWLTPWDATVTVNNSDQISVEMTITDDVDFAGKPWNFTKGATGITAVATVTVYKDKSYVELNMKLINNKNEVVGYEYWTCTTFAPGGDPQDMKMVVPIDKVVLKDDWWSWMGTAETAIDAPNHIFEYKNLALFSNWQDMGIAYAYPEVEKKWWGVINPDNEEGVMRIANNQDDTPGLKFWTWGYDNSYDTDPLTFGNSARPYVELWAGHSSQFFQNSVLQPYETKEWTEYYTPTVGLSDVTAANEHGAALLDITETSTSAQFKATVNTTAPGKTFTTELRLAGSPNYVLDTQTFVSGTGEKEIVVNRLLSTISAGNYTLELVLKDSLGTELLKAEVPFTK